MSLYHLAHRQGPSPNVLEMLRLFPSILSWADPTWSQEFLWMMDLPLPAGFPTLDQGG